MHNNIKALRAQKGMTQQDLADCLGVSWQTVSNVERGHTALSSKKIDAYARCLGVETHRILAAPAGGTVTVKALVQAGHFAESWEADESDWYEVELPETLKIMPFKVHAAEVRGPSMNRRYPEGSVVFFTDTVETGEDFVPGKRYIVERERADGLREATVKRLWRDEAGKLWLVPESDDPRFSESIPLEGGEDDTVRIVGRVRGAFVRED